MWRPGDIIGDYEILAHLKTGGMATLYLARRRGAAGFSRRVAIKVIHPRLESHQTFVRMFVDEAMLCSRIQHPNVVQVEEFGEWEGTHFLVMEYVPGCSLSELTRALRRQGRRMSTELACAITMRIADGLHAAHETRDDNGQFLNIVHRDVSPTNVLIANVGYVKLIDFGVAKAANHQEKTASGIVKGKYQYMAPEQALGRIIDRRTDIFALGVVLWELLTMETLFDVSSTDELMDRLRGAPIPQPSLINEQIPEKLDDLVMKTLAQDPEYRPQTAQELRSMLYHAIPESLRIDSAQIAALINAIMPEEMTIHTHRAKSPAVSKLAPNEARLVIETASQKGEEFRISQNQSRWIVGRGRDVHWTLDDLDASREHFVISVDEGKVRIEDLHSKNGTFVNGIKQSQAVLKPGDVIVVGSTSIRFEQISATRANTPSSKQKEAVTMLTKNLLKHDMKSEQT
ncbi:MAG: protein kinase [Myxococcales bacterium]|nr:MAG: protein kinase [Myxococcales bacterium]